VNGAYMGNAGRESILTAFPSLAAASAGIVSGAEPEETERLLARMMDVICHVQYIPFPRWCLKVSI
jgi:hypothetical protein